MGIGISVNWVNIYGGSGAGGSGTARHLILSDGTIFVQSDQQRQLIMPSNGVIYIED